jgi:Flp pilus assembly protein TadG
MSLVKHFGSDKSGAVSVLFAVTLVPLLVFSGAAVDYSRITTMRTKIQSAADAASLAVAKAANGRTDAELQAMGERIFEGVFSSSWEGDGPARRSGEFTRTDLKITRSTKRITVNVAGRVDTTFMRLAGVKTMDLAARSQSGWGTRNIEVALVLDNTGSMDKVNKMVELKKAAIELVRSLASVATEPGSVKIGLVPFTTQVRVDTALKDEPWLNFSAYSVNKKTWTGCVADRDQPYDANDDLQRTNVVDLTAQAHPARMCAATRLAPVVPLTTNFASLNTAIGNMVAEGATNVTIGLAWGQALLSPGAPLTGAAAFGTPEVEKFIIMLTDGKNTQNRWAGNESQINTRTKAACNSVKDPAKKITLYTIRVIDGDADLLRACATSSAYYKEVNDASQIKSVFQAIAAEISAIRVTM